MGSGRPSLEELRAQVDEADQRVASLTSEVEARMRSLEVERSYADEAERQLGRALSHKKGFFEMAGEALEWVFEHAGCGVMVLVVVVVGGAAIVELCGDAPGEPEFALEALGSAMVVADSEVPLGSRCDLHLEKAAGDYCLVRLDCGAAVFEQEARCREVERSESDGDDTTYWSAIVLTGGKRAGAYCRMDTDQFSLDMVSESGAYLELALHELSWVGEL